MTDWLIAIAFFVVLFVLVFGNVHMQDGIQHARDTIRGYRIVDAGRAMTLEHAMIAIRFKIETENYTGRSFKTQVVGTEKAGYMWAIKVKK